MATTKDNTEKLTSASQKKDTTQTQTLPGAIFSALFGQEKVFPVNEFQKEEDIPRSDSSSSSASKSMDETTFEEDLINPASFIFAVQSDLMETVDANVELPSDPIDELPTVNPTDTGFTFEGVNTPTVEQDPDSWVNYLKTQFRHLNTKLLEALSAIIDMVFALGAALNKKNAAQGLGDYSPVKGVAKLASFINDKVVDWFTSLLSDVAKRLSTEAWNYVVDTVKAVFLMAAATATKSRDIFNLAFASVADFFSSENFSKLLRFIDSSPLLKAILLVFTSYGVTRGIVYLADFLYNMFLLWENRLDLRGRMAINIARSAPDWFKHEGSSQGDSNVFDLIGKMVAPNFWSSVAKTCSEINTMATTSAKAYTAIIAVMSVYSDYLVSIEIGVPISQIPIINSVRGATKFINHFNDLMIPEEIIKCRMDPKMRPKYVDLEKEADTLIQTLPSKVDPAARTLLMDYKARVTRVVMNNLNLPQGNPNVRVEPVGMIFFGPAGIGKTIAMLAVQKGLATRWNVPNTCLIRNCVSDFFSDHCGQSFLQFDELQQRVMPVGQDKDLFEWIQAVNTSPWLMPVEMCEQKCSAYANFSAVFATTNRVHFDYRHIVDRGAFDRRVHFRLVPFWKSGVEMDHHEWPGLKFKSLSMLDRHVPLNVDDLNFMVIDDRNQLKRTITFHELIEQVSDLRDRFFKDAYAPSAQGLTDEELHAQMNSLFEEQKVDALNPHLLNSVLVASTLKALVMTRREHAIKFFVEKYPHTCGLLVKHKDPRCLKVVNLAALQSFMSDAFPLYCQGVIQYVPVKGYYEHTEECRKIIDAEVLKYLKHHQVMLKADPISNTKWEKFEAWLKKAIPVVDDLEKRISTCYVTYAVGAVIIVGSACGFIVYLAKLMSHVPEEVGKGENEPPYAYVGHKSDKVVSRKVPARWSKVPKGRSEGGYDNRCSEIANKVLNRSVVYVTAWVSGPSESKCIGAQHGVFVSGRVLLTNRHFITRIRRCNYIEWNDQNNQNTNRCSITALKFWEAPAGDFGLIHVAQCPLKPNIVDSFVSEEEVQDVREASIIFTRPGSAILKTAKELSYGSAIISSRGKLFEDDEGNKFSTSTHMEYAIPTKAGDCGIPIFIQNTMLKGKLFGIHAATFGTSRNVAQFVSREQLEEGLDELGVDVGGSQMESSFCDAIPFNPPVVGVVNSIPNLNLIGTVPHEFATPTGMGTTSLVPTPLQKPILNGAFKPAVCAAVGLPRGEDIVLLNLASKHQHHYTGLAEDYDLAWKTLGEHMLSVSRPLEIGVTTLTFDEAVDGIDGEPYIDHLPRPTAIGWPDNKKFKTTDKKILDKPEKRKVMSKVVFDFLEQCKTCCPNIYFTLFGKDELRPVEKIEERNIRLIYGSPAHATIAFRMLYGPFAAWCMRNHTRNSVCVGMNPFGEDWNYLAERLLSRGHNLFDADIKKFDYNQSIELLSGFPDLVNNWAADDIETQTMRRNIWTSMMNAFVIYGQTIYQRTGNICSGCPVTALVNSLITIVFFLMAWMKIFRERKLKEADPRLFFQHCYIAAFGDDNVLSVVDKIADVYNPRAIVDALATYNITLTAADKGKFEPGEPIPWRKISEVQFLKRAFTFDRVLNRYCSPLSLGSIQKMICWVKKSPDFTSAWRQNLQNAAVELSQHGPKIYEEHANEWNLQLNWLGQRTLAIRSYQTARKELECRSLESYLDLEEFDIGSAQMGHPTHALHNGSFGEAYLGDVHCNAPPAPEGHHCALSTQHCDFDDCPYHHCDFDIWMSENADIYDIRVLPVLDEFNLDIDKETYEDMFRYRSVRNAWYTVYNMISYQREYACTKVRRDYIDASPNHDHGETGWLFMTTHTYFGQAQMSGQITQQTTTFVNDGDMSSSSKTAASSNRYQVKDVSESKQHSLVNFLERPIQLPTISVVTGGVEMTVVATWNFPSLIYTFDMWKDKLRNFRFLRADMNVKVLVNASPFAVGYFIMFYSPFDVEAGVRGWNGSLSNAMGYNYTLINIGNGSSGELTVPFTSPFSGYDQAASTLSDMGEMVLAICIPYQNASGLPCSVSPYVSLRNIVLEVPTDTQLTLPYAMPAFPRREAQKVDSEEIGKAQMYAYKVHAWDRDDNETSSFTDEPEVEEDVKNQSKIVSTTLSATSKALGAFSAIPVVGAFAGLGSGLLAGASAIAKFAGYAKENNLAAVTPMAQVPGARFTNAVGLDDSVVLATHPQNRVAHDASLFGTGEDEMGIAKIVSRESVIQRFTLTQATPAGTILFTIPVTPGYNQTPIGSAGQADSTPLSFVASMFDYWRGGLIYKVIIAKNPFCNFRLGFAFVPGLNTSQITTSTAWETVYRTINDFRDSDSFVFKVPYQSPTHWQEVVIGTASSDYPRWGDPTVQTGSFVCYVDTVLQVNDMVPTSLTGIVLVSGDPATIKFARPTFNNAFPITTFLDEEVGFAQSGTFTGNDSGVNDSQSRVVNYVSLKHSELRAQFAEASCIGEEINSLREVIKRFGLYTNPLGLTNFSIDTAYFGAAGGSGLACLPLWYVSWLFRFYRGGQRFKIRWNPTNGTASAPPKSISSYESLIFFTAAPFPPGGSPVTLSPAAFSHVTYGHINPVHEVNACYYRTTPIAVVSSVATNVCNTRPVVTINIAWPGAAAADLYVMVAAADDFQFGWQVGTPRLARI